jgi:hypothetical protein
MFEQKINKKRDKFHRFLWEYSQFRKDYPKLIFSPFVDLLGIEIVELLSELKLIVPRKHSTFSATITHDVDWPFLHKRSVKHYLGLALALFRGKKHAFKNLINGMQCLFNYKSDDFYTFDKFFSKEESSGFKSAYYFLPDGSNYSMSDPRVKELINNISKKGCEIGFHPGLGTFRDSEKFNSQLQVVQHATNAHIHGGRQHNLQHDPSFTPGLWESASLSYDSTYGFPDHEGFMLGTSFPINIWDFKNRKPSLHHALPLTVMDGTLSKYRQLSPQEALQNVRELIKAVKRTGGVFCLLWHNPCLSVRFHGEWVNVYYSIIDSIAEANPRRDFPFKLAEEYGGLPE